MNAPTTLMQVNRQWSSRPDDQRFLSLPDLHAAVNHSRQASMAATVSSRSLHFTPDPADPARGLVLEGRRAQYGATHWSFGQLAQLAAAPSAYLRTLPAPMAADCLNYGMRFGRDNAEVQLLLSDPDQLDAGDTSQVRAATGPKYGRVWNADITATLMDRFGDGVTGDFRIPGEFGKRVPITKQNTTLYGSDRDIFVFLADEDRRIDVANRRDGQPGAMARGFFVWNSEVGSSSIGAAFFLFDYVCQNRIVWGVQDFKEIRMRHSSGAPDRWLDEITPVIAAYSKASAEPIIQTIAAAQAAKLDSDLDAFLSKRFTKTESAGIAQAHVREEGRPIESVWDAVTGVTAYAKTIGMQDARVAMERAGGDLLDLVAV